ncbi:MAG: hypothetical protein LBR77_00055 [Lachnospiraceae bacterium]|jgi:hypothetical protein|nr:hypothetical protein [Lachnospiraceae bacterium]
MGNEVTYDGAVKSAAFLLNNDCNVPIAKTARFLSELTGGGLNISTGTVSNMCGDFARKTEGERKEAREGLML